jgi:hypothetical protein
MLSKAALGRKLFGSGLLRLHTVLVPGRKRMQGMRQRTVWDWRLKLYPLIVIPMMVYLNALPVIQQSAGPHTALTVAGEAPVQGLTGDGRAFVCPPNPRWPVVEFCWMLTNERR